MPALAPAVAARPEVRYHSALALYVAVIAAALAAVIHDPALFPSRDALLFTQNMTPIALALLLYSFVMLFLHEMAHLIAARATGVPSRLGWGNRMWILVAETDVSQLWTVPRPKRYMTLIAGPLYDLTSASIFMCASYAAARGWLVLSPTATQFCHALVVMHLLNLLWQCNFFLRTDFYFVIANFFGCKNLMGDTELVLRRWAARRLRWGTAPDVSAIPPRELRVVRAYAVIWVLGRVNMFWILATISVPIMWGYMSHIASVLASGFSSHPMVFIDALVLGIVTVTVEVAGFSMWLRSLLKRKGARHEVAI